ncbi:MAG: hypothetical protein NT167_16320, partial [Verrucomicrobia bacterium]|nr:hypothetical protein [Verrucomicrobiota bacterium]
EGRMQKEERPGEATLMRHQCDIKATSMRVASQAVATLMRPQGSHKAPTKPGDGPWTTGEKLKLGKQKAEMGSLKANAEWRVI